jgi:hypothetical protein
MMVSGWKCIDCHRTFKTSITFNNHKCHPAKGNCEKGKTDCTDPMCRYASFPNEHGPFDLGVPHCSKPGSFDRIYRRPTFDNKETNSNEVIKQ